MKPDPAASPSSSPELDRFTEQVVESLADGSFLRLVLSSPSPDAAPVERILARVIDLRGVSTLSLTERAARVDRTRNLPLDEARDWLRRELPGRFRGGLLETRRRNWQLSPAAGGAFRLRPHPPSHGPVPPRTHDRPKSGPLAGDASRDWLAALGLVDAESGAVRPSRADKLRQVRRYAEILGHLLDEAGFGPNSPLELADMGCGRGALTFAAWHLAVRERGGPARVRGIEARPELALEAEATARRLGLEGLSFQAGTIADVPLDRLDVLIALHACNTATDDALRRGVELGCRLIVVAPCCHQELRPRLGHPEPLAPILRHGIMAERFAEWLTDGLRALVLEWAGYRVKLIEFVASEHTPKNLLLAALRVGPPFQDAAALERILRLRTFFGLTHHALDPLLPGQGQPTPPAP